LIEKDSITTDEQISQQAFHHIIRHLRGNMNGVGETAETRAWTIPMHPPQT
jgi:hypothetical protein